MMIRILILILIGLLFVGPSYAADQESIPKEFLGYWAPLSKTTGETGIDIKDDGNVYYLYRNKTQAKKSYRYIHNTSYRSYLVVRNDHPDKPSLSFWRIRIEKGIQEKRDVLWLEHYSCSLLTMKVFETFSQQSLYDLLNTEECSPDKAIINLDTYSRKAKE